MTNHHQIKQRETLATIDGLQQKVVYRPVEEDSGTAFEGLVGKLPFSFSCNGQPLTVSRSLTDIALRKAVIAAVLECENENHPERKITANDA